MPNESADHALVRQTAAIASVDDFIVDKVGGERLPSSVMGRYSKHGYTLGWCVQVDFSDGSRRELHVLGDGSFPYTAPRVAVVGGPDILVWPHLEWGGLLCILPTDAAVSVNNPTGVVEFVLGEACKLIEDNITGANADDFRKEFLSYWLMAVDRDVPRFISLIEPCGPSRRVLIWHGKGARVIADDRRALSQWLSRWGARAGKGKDYTFHDGVLVWLPEPLLPSEYPGTAADIRVLAKCRAPDAAAVLEDLAASRVDEIDLLLGAPTENGTCFGAVTVRPPRVSGGPKRKGDPLVAGFRPGHVPKNLLVSRYLSEAASVTKATVERADHLWIHGRDHDSRQERLRRVRIAVLGCGSLGAPLVRLLAQSGVGNFLLVDCGRMDWPNVGRHELSATSVGRSKALELAREIEQGYPHLGDISARQHRVGPDATDLVEELATCDLIVSTMGNWAAENFLNDLQQHRTGFPPILYGWVEPNAAAAHAVLIPQGGACFRCGVDDKGRPDLRVTSWAKGRRVLQEPACGALFTPYGPTELCWAHALLAENVVNAIMAEAHSAMHRAWIGPRSRIDAGGGAWSEKWVTDVGDPGGGGITVERAWPASANCPVCGRQVHAA